MDGQEGTPANFRQKAITVYENNKLMSNPQSNEEASKKWQLLDYQQKQLDDATSSPLQKIIILPYYVNSSNIDENEEADPESHSYSDIVNLENLGSPLKVFGNRGSRFSASYGQVNAEKNQATYGAYGENEDAPKDDHHQVYNIRSDPFTSSNEKLVHALSTSFETDSAFSLGDHPINNQSETRLRGRYEQVKEIPDNTIHNHNQNDYVSEIASFDYTSISSDDVIKSISSANMPLLYSDFNIIEEFVEKQDVQNSRYNLLENISTKCDHNKDDEFRPPNNDNKIIEPTVSELERGIVLRTGATENKKSTNLQLPPEMIPATSSHCEREIVGDDAAKTNAHILCECDQPGVAGGAVPVVRSFTLADDNAKCNDQDKSKPESELPLSKDHGEMENTVVHKPKPSLIPKLSSSFRNQKSSSLKRTERSHCLIPPPEEQFQERAKVPRNVCSTASSSKTKKYSPIFPKKNHKDKAKEREEENEKEKHCRLRFDDVQSYKKLKVEFSKAIYRVSQDASKLSEMRNLNTQLTAANILYQQMTTLKKVADELKVIQTKAGSDIENRIDAESSKGSRSADNQRVHIKILPSKSAVKKRKIDHTEVQGQNGTNVITSDVESLTKPSNEEACPKAIDSVDGMFIPSKDEPPKMAEDDDDDDDGLAITIRFPESQEAVSEEDPSHLSLAISNISTEALGRLKRCPKEFTLRVDFVQRKLIFQSGKSTADNFEIDQDLKLADRIIDGKQSEVINIKSPTECLYTSQIIPVEGAIGTVSTKLLKSTDSELIKVVSLPLVNRRNSVDTKSCITFKNMRRVSSESFLPDRTYYKSMPQIPSLTNILEEPTLETIVSGIRTATFNADRKPRNRSIQKKRTNTSLENVLYDTP